jgi:hypothetical protein
VKLFNITISDTWKKMMEIYNITGRPGYKYYRAS